MIQNLKLPFLTIIAMIAFAANSILCREALASGQIDEWRFTLIRLVSGAIVLMLLHRVVNRTFQVAGSWSGSFALFIYAIAFSYAYLGLSAGAGALLLFGSVQASMIAFGLFSGERFSAVQVLGLGGAMAGFVWLMLPSAHAPAVVPAAIMMIAGVAWGVYSLLGRGVDNPLAATSGNFVRASILSLSLLFFVDSGHSMTQQGILYAVGSGALASGLGYAIWYRVLPSLASTSAATIQLSVPVIAAIGGVLFLGEAVTGQFVGASIAILGGVLLFLVSRRDKS